MSNRPEEIEVSTWWKNGGMLINRECLPPNHPEHMYNYMKREFDVDPEDYGVENPLKTRRDVKVIHNHLVKMGYNINIDDLKKAFYEAERDDVCDLNYEENYRY